MRVASNQADDLANFNADKMTIETDLHNLPIDPFSFFTRQFPQKGPNPEPDAKLDSGPYAGVSIRGHPDIGKTLKLDIILILCLLAGRPTA
ncbi:hypothetical protein BV25DRAFT_1922327 [Artomyces pyxidatus]|uniref:Uncharacterized protein n=1 Tax=Artomyces pyxidatus TaxID=48021 RepID=A0ACB8SEB9_9AGAM|nr:hypothetical protein BV25DRAFT_1922327 [Artomyces pyxidatus]